jgi:hypothetical protein
MNKRLKKKKRATTFKFYRGIGIEVNGAYSLGINRVVCFCPDVERYCTRLSEGRKLIDYFLSKYEQVCYPF